MAIDTGPSKKFLQKTTVKIKKKFSDGTKIKMKKTFSHPRSTGGKSTRFGRNRGGGSKPGSIRTGQVPNPMPDRLNANIGFDY